MGKSLRVAIQGALVVGLAIAASCGGPIEDAQTGTISSAVNSPTCPTGSNWVGSGNYCYSEPGMLYSVADHLYYCGAAGGSAGDLGNCAEDCHKMPAGTNDVCYSANCPAFGNNWHGAGLYCGREPGMTNANPDIVYYCSSPTAKGLISRICTGACVNAPPGQPDHC